MAGVATTELSAETRTRILDAAWEMVRERGPAALNVKAVAADAGVSRQLVYFHYAQPRRAAAGDGAPPRQPAGFARALAVARELDAVPALEALLRAWLDYLPEILPVARALEAALITGEEGGAAWRDRMGELREIIERAVARVDAAGSLAQGWEAATATDWIWARVQPASWSHLVEERGWAPSAFAERTVRSLLAECVA